MNSDQIIDLVKKYISKTYYNYAILIDGDWGAGKTYFVKKTLIPNIKEDEELKYKRHQNYNKKEIIYISLYDLTSKDELIKQLSIQTMPQDKLSENKIYNAIMSSNRRIITGASISSESKINSNSEYISLENCIMIFDDLERCNMCVNVILGYINNFVEHYGIKVIIIANEKEINTPINTLNKELKYLLATNENILFPEEKNENLFEVTKSNVRNNTKINIKELDRRINYLFGEDELYKLIKEKLIGVTIYYKPEIISIIDELVSKNIINEKVKKIILSVGNKEFIKNSFEFYEHHNIRTLLFGIDKFESLIVNLKEDIDVISYRKVFDEIFKYFIAVSIIYKSGKVLYNWSDNKEIEVIPLTDSSKMRDYIKGFKFVDDFISRATFNKEKVIKIIKRESEILKEETLDYSNPLYKLNNGWWLMEDDEAEEMIKKVISLLKEDPQNYSSVNYSSILYFNIILLRIGISSIDIKEVLEIMKKNLKSLRIENKFNTFGYAPIFDEEQDKLKYSEAIQELNEELKQTYKETKEMELKDILKNGKEWSNKLSNYAFNSKSDILSQKAFLSKFKTDELIKVLKSSTNEQISDFRSTIKHTIYSFSNISEYYQADKDTIEKIINQLEIYLDKIKDNQKIKTVNFQFLINDLKDINQKLSVIDSSNIK